MRFSTLKAALLLSVVAVAPARADVSLLAIGTLDGTSDLSGLTGTLENGVAANILGGLGSGIAFAGGDTFLAVPDRGPNAVPFDSKIDDTASYINRFQTLKLNLTANDVLIGCPLCNAVPKPGYKPAPPKTVNTGNQQQQ